MGLDRLIETEGRNEALLAEAREEAAGLVRGAAEAAARRRDSLAAELDAELRRRAAAVLAERDRRLADVERMAAETAARYDTVTEDQVVAAAAALIERLMVEGPAP